LRMDGIFDMTPDAISNFGIAISPFSDQCGITLHPSMIPLLGKCGSGAHQGRFTFRIVPLGGLAIL